MRIYCSILLLLSTALSAGASECDFDTARMLFGQCAVCHSLEPDVHMMGPSLAGIAGRQAAAAAGFSYSLALKQLDLRWDVDTLDMFLQSPMTVVPGTTMAYGGLKNTQARADIICLLMSEVSSQ